MTQLPPHRTILIVEDDADIRECIVDVLREAGREVVTASDGVEALARLDTLPRPCLILLDLMMPRMDGWEFLERLKRHPHAAEFPVLVLSAHAGVQSSTEYPGVLGTLRKPFDLRSLMAWVERHC